MRRPRTGRTAPAARAGARHRTAATHRLNAGAERVDIQALLGYSTINTAQIDTRVGQERMAKVVAWL
jgi:site-specific recombinase XerD